MTSVWISWILKCKPLSGFFFVPFFITLLCAHSVDRYLGLARMWTTALSRHIGFASRMRSPMCGKKGEGGRAGKSKGKGEMNGRQRVPHEALH